MVSGKNNVSGISPSVHLAPTSPYSGFIFISSALTVPFPHPLPVSLAHPTRTPPRWPFTTFRLAVYDFLKRPCQRDVGDLLECQFTTELYETG